MLHGQDPADNDLFERAVFFLGVLHVGDAELFVADVAAEHALIQIATVLYEKAVDDFFRPNDGKTVGTVVAVLNTDGTLQGV